MASRSQLKQAYRLFAPRQESVPAAAGFASDEFDESEVWGSAGAADPAVLPAEFRRPVRSGRKKPDRDHQDRVAAPASLPVNIPDWSKILKDEYKGNHGNNFDWAAEDDDDGREVTGAVVPPHELAWRRRGNSFSVHEGVGRTLKGRDLSRVRNAIWEKTGFQD